MKSITQKAYSVLITFLISVSLFSQSDESKIEVLISKMTLQEKIGQVNQLNTSGLSDDMKGLLRAGKVGSILNEVDPKTVNELQKIAVKESRLGIPLIFARDVIHGFRTVFPIPLGQAATWNPQIIEDGARIAAIESSACGIRWTFAPMIDVSRDPRWGRIAESLGEDPYLTSVLGSAMIKGFQGDNLSNSNSVAACAKHFAGYGATESGKDYNTTWIPENQLRDTYLPPFQAAAKAGVATFMCSFNDINGVPSSENKHLNIDILRKEWNFDGILVSDWGSIEQLINHGVCKDLKEAAEKAMNAGVGMDMMGYAYVNHLEELIKSGKVSEKLLDDAVRNVLRIKFRLGLFENPYVKIPKTMPFYTEEALEKAKKSAIESVVLLKNKNNILPLSQNVKTVAVIGPLSDAPKDQIGTWCFDAEAERSETPLMAIQKYYGNQVTVIAKKGLTYSRDKSKDNIQKALNAAQKADVVLFFAGEEAILSGEAKCRADINLPGAQSELLEALKNTGKPVVLIVMAGRPLTIGKEIKEADAVMFAFHGGTMAGPALADLIFGKETPSGKLPVTFPKMVGQIPIYYAHKNTGRPASNITLIDDIPVGAEQFSIGSTSYFLDAGTEPLFPFGYGLSYTTFKYSDVQLSNTELTSGSSIKATCSVTNTGTKSGAEIVQLYIRDKVASLARPVRELKGFQKVYLKAGESTTVSFTITPEQLKFYNLESQKVIEPGEFQVWISKDSASGSPVSFQYK
ncbi:Periplasmic beta-glucosidase [uncultured Paludibacter sp.]|nr:Periplasmic beta-glucosidase [uncultured Paludibacter sp.]